MLWFVCLVFAFLFFIVVPVLGVALDEHTRIKENIVCGPKTRKIHY